ncbi:MAG: hypothetical protein HYT34_00620, partial [Candidatus Ryanbacteria bacterium]|nr:hypothetical protein [Candidatus Ryanbacteria bacterium]
MLFSIKNILREYQAIIIPTSIFLVTALVYGQIVFNDFVYDDYFGIIFNQYVHNSINPITYFTNPGYLFNGNKAPGTYRPLSVWFTAIQIKFFGIDPLYFHFFSLIIH